MNILKMPIGVIRGVIKAKRLINDYKAVKRIADQASAKAGDKSRYLIKAKEELALLVRMLKAWSKREYSDVPASTITLVLAAVIYFLSPLDLIPDFIAGIGFIDDISVITYVIQSIRKDLAKYKEWEIQSTIEKHWSTYLQQAEIEKSPRKRII